MLLHLEAGEVATQAGSVGFEKFNVLNSQVCISS